MSKGLSRWLVIYSDNTTEVFEEEDMYDLMFEAGKRLEEAVAVIKLEPS